MVKSLRGFGYRPATAIADLIDNSLTAGASVIRIEFQWDEAEPSIRVVDNGHGMTPAQLVEAMRLGSDTSVDRSPSDHGRFGLGLKTGSFSQTRVLTVCSKIVGGTAAIYRWDIDHVETADKWDLQEGPQPGSEKHLADIAKMQSGTIVLWEKLDALLPNASRSIDTFFEIADSVSGHIGMVFHRFISAGTLAVTVNGATVRAWDPFMAEHAECVTAERQILQDANDRQKVVVIGYVLPARSQLTDEEYELGAGPAGWLEQQGFYVYRNDRLIVSGGWLGLGRGTAAWHLEKRFVQARISVDISNATDSDWGLDVRKTMASPPAHLAKPLRRIADEIRRLSKNAHRAFRGTEKTSKDEDNDVTTPIWVALPKSGPVPKFRINRRHPTVRSLRSSVRDPKKLREFLSLIDREAPVQPRMSPVPLVNPGPDANRTLQNDSIRQLVSTIYYSHRNGQGLSVEDARREILSQPTFKEHEALVVVTIEEIERRRTF